MALVSATDGDSQSHCGMTDLTPASASLQGIPPELRNKIYGQLLTESRNVSDRRLLELREDSPGGDFWKQFQSAIAAHPLTATCRQMRAEFSPILASTAGQNCCLVVDNVDLHHFALFREFIATYCFSHRISDKNSPPLLFQEVIPCLRLDSTILPSVEAFGQAARCEARCPYVSMTRAGDFAEVKILPEASSGVLDHSTSRRKCMSKAQAKLARGALRRMCDAYEFYEPDRRVMRLLITHLTEMVDNHWPTTSDEIGDTWRSLQAEGTLYKAPRFTNAPGSRNVLRSNNAPRSNDSIEPDNGIGMKILPALLFIVVVGILKLVPE